MEQNKEQIPQSEQGQSQQQDYWGWQPDDDQKIFQPDGSSYAPLVPGRSLTPALGHHNQQPYQSDIATVFAQRPVSESDSYGQRFQNQYPSLQDMGTSLGYGQGMAYQYFATPQPSQPIAKLREDRLQQLRLERLHRQPLSVNEEASVLFPGMSKWSRWVTEIVFGRNVSQSQSHRPKTSPSSPAAFRQSYSHSRSVLPERENNGTALEAEVENLSAQEALSVENSSQDSASMQRLRIGQATLLLTAAFVVSRVLGLIRTSLFAFVFGTSSTSDAYLQAFLIPALIFNIVAGGALLSAFIPVFTHYMASKNDQRTAWHIASSTLNLALVLMGSLAIIAIIFAPALVPLYNPAVHDPHQLALITALTRIMLLQAIALGAGVIVTSVLNAQQDFRLPAIGTVLYNVGLIIGLVPGFFLVLRGARNEEWAIYAATWGVVLGAVLQVGIQVPGLRRAGMQYSFSFDWRHPGVIQVARQMVPRVINAAMLYLAIFVDRGLIQLLVVLTSAISMEGLITQYYQSFQLVLLPLGVFGMAVSTAAFPALAENVARGRIERVRGTILETLRSILFMSIPSSIGLIILGLPIIQVLLQHGRYTLADAQATALPLAFFAIGLTGLAASEILTRAFYAMRDSVTPVVVSVAQFGMKIILSLLFINLAVFGSSWGLAALALATSLAGTLEAVVMYWLLHRRLGQLRLHEMGKFIVRVLIAAGIMGLCLLAVRIVLDILLPTTQQPTLQLWGTGLALLKLLIELFVGIFVYVRAARLLRIQEVAPLKRVLDRFKLSWI